MQLIEVIQLTIVPTGGDRGQWCTKWIMQLTQLTGVPTKSKSWHSSTIWPEASSGTAGTVVFATVACASPLQLAPAAAVCADSLAAVAASLVRSRSAALRVRWSAMAAMVWLGFYCCERALPNPLPNQRLVLLRPSKDQQRRKAQFDGLPRRKVPIWWTLGNVCKFLFPDCDRQTLIPQFWCQENRTQKSKI